MIAGAEAALSWRSPSRLALGIAAMFAGSLIVAAMFFVAAGEVSLLAAAALLFGPILALLAIVRPVPALAILCAMLATNASQVLRDEHGAPGVAKAVLLLVVVGLLMRGTWRAGVIRSTPLISAILLFALARLLSALPNPGGADITQLVEGLITGLAIVTALASVGISRDWVRRLPKFAFGGVAVLSVVTLVQAFGVRNTLGGFAPGGEPTGDQLQIFQRGGTLPEQFDRLLGPVNDPNFWAQSLVLLLPIGLWWLQSSRSKFERVLVIGGMLAIVAAVLQTQSRGGLLALTVAIVALGVMSPGPMRRLAAILPIILIFGIVATGQLDRIALLADVGSSNAQSIEDEALSGRLSENLAAIAMFRDRPVIGIGANQFEANYSTYAAEFGIDDRVERQAHNSYLEMAAESGILGVATFIGMIIAGLGLGFAARRRLRELHDYDMAGLAEVLIAGLIAYAVAAIFLHQAFPEYLWLGLGFIAGVHYFSTLVSEDDPDDEEYLEYEEYDELTPAVGEPVA